MSEEPQETGDQMEAAAPVADAIQDSAPAEANQERQVPLDALQAERAERQKLQSELEMMRDNMNLMMNQYQGGQQPSGQPEEQISKDDVITYGDLEKILEKKERQYNMSIQEMKISQKHPDYQEIVTKYLPDVLKNNPSLRKSLEQTQDYELAYVLAKQSDGYRAEHKKVKRNADAERIVQNTERAGSLSSVGQTSPISQAKRYKQMTDSEFKQEMQKNLGYY